MEPQDLIVHYALFQQCVERMSRWKILPWNERTAQQFSNLEKLRPRIGTKDLRIASIALAHNATVLTANLRDFQRVPNLRVENWLD